MGGFERALWRLRALLDGRVASDSDLSEAEKEKRGATTA
jgi:hypothetical protein